MNISLLVIVPNIKQQTCACRMNAPKYGITGWHKKQNSKIGKLCQTTKHEQYETMWIEVKPKLNMYVYVCTTWCCNSNGWMDGWMD